MIENGCRVPRPRFVRAGPLARAMQAGSEMQFRFGRRQHRLVVTAFQPCTNPVLADS